MKFSARLIYFLFLQKYSYSCHIEVNWTLKAFPLDTTTNGKEIVSYIIYRYSNYYQIDLDNNDFCHVIFDRYNNNFEY